MDAELRAYLEGLESRLRQQVSDVGSKLGGLESKLGGLGSKVDGLGSKVDSLEVKVDGLESKLGDVESRLRTYVSDGIEKLETKLLTEFWKWGRTSDMRNRQALTDIVAVSERLLAIEDRVTDLERRRAS